jgi:hypothetical protein
MVDEAGVLPDDTVLWRYLSFLKLIALLSQRALYFSRCDGFLDPFEGALGPMEYRESLMTVWDGLAETLGNAMATMAATASGLSWQAPTTSREGKPHKITLDDDKLRTLLRGAGGDPEKLQRELVTDMMDDLRDRASKSFMAEYESTFLCCWHSAEYESEAMWRLYAKDTTEGIAIRTTAGLLRASLEQRNEIMLCSVEYSDDYAFRYSRSENKLARFFTKRRAFAHEREVRAIKVDRDAGLSKLPGVYVPVIVENLIQGVVISPYAPAWMPAVLQDVTKRFDLPAPVETSKLSAKAFYA